MLNGDEDYTTMVRKSLSRKKVQKKAGSSSGLSKVKVNFEEYKSENVFEEVLQSENFQKKKPKIKKSKRNKSKSCSFDDTFFSSVKIFPDKMREMIPRKMKSKKPLLLDSFTTESHSDNMDLMSPSKSEIDNIPFLAKKDQDVQIMTKEQSVIFLKSSEDFSNSDFDFNSFFSSTELGMNESTNAQNCSLNYRIMKKAMKNVNINSSHIYNNIDPSDLSSIDVNNEEIEYEYKPKKSINSKTLKHLNNNSNQDYNNSEDENYVSRTNANKEEIQCEHNSKPNIHLENVKDLSGKVCESVCPENSVLISDSEGNNTFNNLYKSCAKYYTEENEKFVRINKNSSISVFGVIKLKVIEGKIDVLGYILDELSKEITLYSPRGSALLILKNISNYDSVVKYTEVMDNRLPFIEKHISQQIFPHAVENLPRVTFEPKDISCVFNMDNSWDDLLDTMNQSSKLLITGGKGVGKSTFLRYALNKLLNRFEKVRIVDLDTGQSEFTIPGCVSVLTVTEPVFGPNYTHLSETERSYLSNINIGHDPSAYIKCIQMLVKYIQTLDDMPTLINYMGFVQGIGLNILSSVITYLKPTDVVQINSKNKKKNFRMDLSVKVILEHCNLFRCCSKNINFKVHKLKALNDENEGWSLEPRQARELSVLAYFGKMMTETICSLSSHMLPMYEIDLGSIKLVNLQGVALPPAAVNANLVAMCYLEENSNIFSCLGYELGIENNKKCDYSLLCLLVDNCITTGRLGQCYFGKLRELKPLPALNYIQRVVRGVDLDNGTLILLTPEAQEVLEKVYYLVLGSVLLPPAVYMTADGLVGNIPYVMEGELFSLAQITRRTYLPVNRNKI